MTRVERIEVPSPADGGLEAPRIREVRVRDHRAAAGSSPDGGERVPPPAGPWEDSGDDGERTEGFGAILPVGPVPPAGPGGPGGPSGPGGGSGNWGSSDWGSPGGGQPLARLSRRTLTVVGGVVAALVLVGGLAGVAMLRGGDGGGSLASSLIGASETTKAPAPPAQVVVAPANDKKSVKPDARIKVSAKGGRLTSVKVTAKGGKTVVGKLASDGSTWESTGRMVPDTRYTVTARAENTEGKASTTKTSFTTLTPSAELNTAIMPLDGETVGVGMPIGIFFDAPVRNKAAVEKQLQVATGSDVVGAWRWFGDREVRWRPKSFWPAGEQVTLRVKLTGIDAGGGVWGMADRIVRFKIGDSRISTVSVPGHSMSVAVNGKVVKTMNVSTGKDKFPTTNGIHTVIEKNRHKVMDSATIGIPKDSPEYYRTKVEYAVRISNTGEFVHSAPWSVNSQGNANVSHGCVNLSPADAAWFFRLARRGDVVKVIGSPRQPSHTEGLIEWNRSFDSWKAGGAL